MRGARHECHVCVSRAVRAPGGRLEYRSLDGGRGTGGEAPGRAGAAPARAQCLLVGVRHGNLSPSRPRASAAAGRPVPVPVPVPVALG